MLRNFSASSMPLFQIVVYFILFYYFCVEAAEFFCPAVVLQTEFVCLLIGLINAYMSDPSPHSTKQCKASIGGLSLKTLHHSKAAPHDGQKLVITTSKQPTT